MYMKGNGSHRVKVINTMCSPLHLVCRTVYFSVTSHSSPIRNVKQHSIMLGMDRDYANKELAYEVLVRRESVYVDNLQGRVKEIRPF